MDVKNLNKDRKQRNRPAMDMNFGRVPPQARELESAVLGAIMVDVTAYDSAVEILVPDCFYSEANQRIFSAMQSLARKNMPIDLLTVVEELKIAEDLDLVGGPYYVSKLTNGVMSGANIEAHARIILEKFISREIIRVAGELISDAYDDSTDAFDLLDQAEEKVMQIGAQHVHGGMMEISSVLDKAVEMVEEWRLNDSTLTGIPSGFSELDRATRGWQGGDLIILAARPSVGKTAFALNLVRYAALNTEKPVTVAVWSLEMKAVYLALRMMAAESEIYLHRLQTGRMDDEQMAELISKGVNKLKQAKIFFDENTNITLRTLRAKARKLKKKNKLGLIVIDYLQLMSSDDSKGNREQEIAKISRGLKNLALELDVPIIALSQLSRAIEAGITWKKGPGLSALRESGAIEQDADMVIMLWGPSKSEVVDDPNMDGKRRAKIEKQRNGMLVTVDLDFKNEIQLFEAMQDKIEKKSPLPGNFIPVPQSPAVDHTGPSSGSRFSNDDIDDLPF